MKFEYPQGATPLDLDEIAGLIPDHITTQGELNEWEQANILDAQMWLSRQSTSHVLTTDLAPLPRLKSIKSHNISLNMNKLLDTAFIQQVHKKMFDKTWRWAGKFRKSNKNIGVDWINISTMLHQLLDDIKHQVAHQAFAIDEIAIKFHHRLVAIHPFPNGNGRHSRMVTDLFLSLNNTSQFSWGQTNISDNASIRKKYIQALQAADRHDYGPLLTFARR